MSEFISFAGDALSGLVYGWPVTVVLCVLCVIGVLRQAKSEQRNWGRLTRWIGLLTFCPVLILVAGVVWAGAEKYPSAQYWRSSVAIGLLGLEVVIALIAIIRCKGARFLMTGAGSMLVWCSWWCLFIASMSIVDDWL